MNLLNQESLVLTVGPCETGKRLDVFLAERLAQCSRSCFKKLIEEGQVLVNGSRAKPGYLARVEDAIRVDLPRHVPEEALEPERMPLEILFEDQDLLIVNKAPGIVVHPGAGHSAGTLVHGLLAHVPRLALQGAPRRPGIVHRLDKDTSGALVVAKTERAYLDLAGQFKEHTVTKEYLALVYGDPKKPEGEISNRLDRHPVDRKKMTVVQNRGREAVSRWRVERSWGETALLRVLIETGRTHQIRVHLSHMQHPVVGDDTYGGGKHRARRVSSKPLREVLLDAERQMLHAFFLEFQHPVKNTPVSVTAPLAPDFSELIRKLDEAERSLMVATKNKKV